MTAPEPAPTASAAPPSGPKPESERNRYRATLNLPKTAFPMKANLVQNEPASLKRWQAMGLYERVREARAGAPRFRFHDGPPYANGSIHMGHLMNKCLKDFVVRSRTLAGMDCPYIPGWDCHGLPIEHKVMTEMLERGRLDKLRSLPDDQRRMAIRRECRRYAEKYVKLQAGQMQRLLTLADYEHPYLTMAPEYEGATLEVLAALLEQGLVYRALKPVHWSIANETALAEAELEYYDRQDISVYVDFEAEDSEAVYDAFGLRDQEDTADPEITGDFDRADQDEGDEMPLEAVLPEGRPHTRPSFMIWTTTPWTLPANQAIAVNPDLLYALLWVDGNITVVAHAAVERVVKAAGAERWKVLSTCKGHELVGLKYRHPFVDPAGGEGVGALLADPAGAAGVRERWPALFTVVAADYVTLEDGTGLVHTAPGHGQEDFETGRVVGLPAYSPVRGDGTYDATVPEWLRGRDIWKANTEIVEHLRASGHLFHDHTFTHSYPHDWRSKTPVIFRCTEQWFVSVDQPTKRDDKSLRQAALEAVGAETEAPPAPSAPGIPPPSFRPGQGRVVPRVRFVPEWGRNRMRGMLESRPDWCISRQRAWGLPIPAFELPDGTMFMTAASVRAVARVVREKGSDVWFTATPEELLRHYDLAADPDAPRSLTPGVLRQARKGPDILDVWFESGSSWNAVMRERSGGADFPVDLYLEGSDQHRGWFQTSLLPALGMMGVPPYRTILTHGFMVDKEGRKLSKSKGDTVEDLFNDYGADVLRWWVASLSYENDVKVDREFFDLAGESYRKVRNTLRFMLGNLYDFDRGRGAEGQGNKGAIAPTSLEAWVLAAYDRMAGEVLAAYERYDFQAAHKALYGFCNDTLSATYLAAIKDRLYCDRPDSPRRRRTQAALFDLTDGLCRLLAPFLCHTADEAYRALHHADAGDPQRTVHTQAVIRGFGVAADPAWEAVFAARERALVAIERAKAELGVENPLDAGVVLPDPDGTLARFDPADLADLLGVSRVTLDAAASEPRVLDLRSEPRCERSWKRDGTVRQRSDGGWLTDRDAAAVGL